MRPWTLVEPCCGSAALTLHTLGARHAIVPYQGSKWSLRHQLSSVLMTLGFWGVPSRVVLTDASLWAEAIGLLLERHDEVAQQLQPLVDAGSEDPKSLYATLKSAEVPTDPIERAAALLWLQRMSFASKAVATKNGRWIVHGLNSTAAFGRKETALFGEVRPLGPALMMAVLCAPRIRQASYRVGLASPEQVADPTVVYVDPPYVGTSDYPAASFSRSEVVEYALAWSAAGAAVIVSESEPVRELFHQGWETRMLRDRTRADGNQPFRRATRGQEWVTFTRSST